jgi:monofunctional biosynthetic peptidoglycan transglycosylase
VRYTLHLLLVPVLAAAGFLWYGLATLPDVARLARANPNTTVVIEARRAEADEKGRPFILSWTWTPLGRISPHLQRAVIVAEDASFYQHYGFDWEGLQEAFTHNWEQGKLRRGGSTITQQLAKNLYLSSEKTLLRKAREALIAWEIERCLPKQRILELYLNVAEWGHGVFGAEEAARHHFEKSADELTEDEAALLAALLPSPRRHDPIQHPSVLVKRQQEILYWMHRENGNQQHSAAAP